MDEAFSKELAAIVGATEDAVINWKLRGMRPLRNVVKEKIKQFVEN